MTAPTSSALTTSTSASSLLTWSREVRLDTDMSHEVGDIYRGQQRLCFHGQTGQRQDEGAGDLPVRGEAVQQCHHLQPPPPPAEPLLLDLENPVRDLRQQTTSTVITYITFFFPSRKERLPHRSLHLGRLYRIMYGFTSKQI